MNILILNWRDIKNPESGGAEVLTHELAKRWTKAGNYVVWFSSSFKGGIREEKIDGIKIVRRGNSIARFFFNSVHFLAYIEYKKRFEGKFDVVIDEIHGLPFFTPWYVKEKKIALICEVADELWMKMFTPIFGIVGKAVEVFYLRFVYRNIPFLTISESTKKALMYHGIKEKNVRVLPMGISVPKVVKKFEKEKFPTLIYVGRVSRLKGIEDAFLATKIIKKTYPHIRLWVLGRGRDDYISNLRYLSRRYGISQNLVFYGFVDENKKFELLSRAHILIAPSSKEGFGLTIPEAGFVGTPAVVYNIPGFFDIVKHEETGIICKQNTPGGMAENTIKLLINKTLYARISRNIAKKSKEYNWNNTANFTLRVLEKL